MLSLGIEASRAFCTASPSAGLASTLPPPSRAATVIARASLVKGWPGWASGAPSLCVLDDHFEGPDRAPILRGRREDEGGAGWRPVPSPPAGPYLGLVAVTLSLKQSSVPVPCMLLSSITSSDQGTFVAFLSPSPSRKPRLSCGAKNPTKGACSPGVAIEVGVRLSKMVSPPAH